MASYKSSRLNPPRREEQTPQAHRTVPTRLPQRSVTPTITASHQASSTHSKLQKRNPNKDEQMYPSRGFSSQRGTAAKASTTAPSRQERTAGLIGPVSSSQSKPSMSKKITAQATSSRLPKLEVPRTVITPTPSLISGSSVSTTDSPRSGLLRKKQSSIGPRSRTREDSVTPLEERQPIKQSFAQFKDPFSETVLGITIPPSSSIMAPIQVETEFPYNYELGPTDIMAPALPQYAPSTTPSTGYSESPSLFSISSTPTSMSSYSPGVAFPGKPAPRMRQASPLSGKPPIGRLAAPEEHGLSAVRESARPLTSTSPAQTEPQADKPVVARRPSETIGQKPRVQAPPELAHLADSSAGRRPSRPSREGTSDITGLRGPSPIIQSNMSSFPSSHRRIPSTGSVTGATNNANRRFGIPSKPSSRNPSPNPSRASGFAPPSRVPTRGTTPELEKQRSQTLPSSAPSPSKSSRFGFFTRRTKTESSATKPEKKHRRGPAAGTGHEGYGRYAVRGRSGSMGSVAASIGRSASAATTSESLDRTPSTRKSSVTSTSSTEMDDFLLNRLVPRVIRGNGSTNSLTRSPEPMGSTTSLTASSSQNEKSTAQDLEIARPALLPSAMSDPVRSISPIKKPVLGFRRTSESDDDSKRSFIPSLASKRTSRLSKIVDAPPASRVPTSGNALVKGRTGSTGGYASEGKESNWLKNSKQDKTEKEKEPNKSRKWNFFQRAHAAPRVATPAVETVSPARVPVSRSVAHYALASEAGVNLDDLEQLIEDDSSPESESARTGVLGNPSPIGTPEVKERLQSMLLPPKPVLPADFSVAARPASPKVFLHAEPEVEAQPSKLSVDTSFGQKSQISDSNVPADLTPVTDLSPCSSPSRPSSPVESLISPKTTPAPLPLFSSQVHSPPPGPPPSHLPPKPSRLAQVGRIPQVVSSRNNMHRSSQSFSRPFAVNQPRPFSPPRTSFDSFGSISATSHPMESYPVLQGLDAITHASAIANLSPSAEEATRQSEFFKFPLRKDSEVSYSSSSGTWSFPATAGTAVIPVTGAPQSEDEVWNEYDDLIDEVLSPAGSDAKEKSTRTRSSLEPLPLNVKTDPNHPSYHLRRSRLLSVLHAQSPTSPISLSDFLQGCGDKTISVVDPVTGRLSFPSTTRMSTGSTPRNRASSTRSSLPASLTLSARQSKATLASSSDKGRESTSADKYRDTRLREFAEAKGDGIVSMANLRFGALMTSKWLSFGRVLFSPAHFELKNPNEDRVLVIDGLGKDWSYYCALTYPEATIYNLGPGASSSPQTNSNTASEPWSTLANHRHINHASPRTAFPFPKGFFACVVIRFPSALPSSVHRFVVSECKRVLRPGGYLELSVLDLDLVNMGNRARRAVRGLKVKMQVADVDTSLRNMSDEIIGLLGRKGFTECNRCFVGVPVAGQLPGPDDSSSASPQRSRKGSTASSLHNPPSSKQVKITPTPKPELSFSELLDMQTSSDDSKENGIADMVARVGRWWYSRCYESVVLPEAGEPGAAASGAMFETSMWRDEALVSECEKRGTSFRLLIGYAQKPEVGVRRTVSV